MVSIECLERGLARYIDEEILPNFPKDGVKGFGLGIAASLLVKRGGNLIREYASNEFVRQLGLVTPDGAVDIDAIRDAAVGNIPAQGLAVDLPLGISMRVIASDVNKLYETIKEEASL